MLIERNNISGTEVDRSISLGIVVGLVSKEGVNIIRHHTHNHERFTIRVLGAWNSHFIGAGSYSAMIDGPCTALNYCRYWFSIYEKLIST